MTKIALTAVAFLSLFMNMVFWQPCVPGSCSDDQDFCASIGPCADETAAQHINERMGIFNSIEPARQLGAFIAALVLFVLFRRYEQSFRSVFDGRLAAMIKKSSSAAVRFHNFLLEFFLKGLINPKVYRLAA